MAVKNPCPTSIRFHYPDEDDIQTVCHDKFVLTFDVAEVKKASKRQAKIIVLEHDRLGEFQPVY